MVIRESTVEALVSSAGRSRADALAVFGLACLLAFAFSAPCFLPSDHGVALSGEGNPVRQITYFLLFGLAVVCARVIDRPSELLELPLPVLLLLGWSTLSLAWSITPEVGARRLLLTVVIIWSIFALVRKNGYITSVAIVRAILPLFLVANYVAVLITPGFGIHQLASELDPSIVGAWRGVMMQKNYAGELCAFTVIFFALDGKKGSGLFRLAIVVAATYFLFRTQSKTAMGVLASSILVAAAFRFYDPRHRVIAMHLLALLLSSAGLFVYVNWTELVAPFNSEGAFTGRVQIWPLLLRFAADHLLLGAGFGSFWNVGRQSPIFSYTDGWVSKLASGHNGYLDLLVTIGLPGLALAIAVVLSALSILLMNVRVGRSRGGLILACVWFATIHNFTESSLFDRDSVVHVFLMFALALLALEAPEGLKQSRSLRKIVSSSQVRASYNWRSGASVRR